MNKIPSSDAFHQEIVVLQMQDGNRSCGNHVSAAARVNVNIDPGPVTGVMPAWIILFVSENKDESLINMLIRWDG